jgi:DNA-binding response OmpR family regulator
MQRILIVDDEPDIRKLYRLEFEEEGFEVATAADSSQALRIVREWEPELVILDIKLGEENGLDLLRRIADTRRSMRTIIVSGYPGYRDDFSSWLADAFLTKSADPTALKHTVRELLASYPVA